MKIGVLALQGAFEAHGRSLEAIGHEVIFVRTAEQLQVCNGLVLPGGESTVHLKLLERGGLVAPLAWFVASGKPVLATCAGLILAASRVLDPEQASFGFLDVTVRRNGWGRQLASFEARDDGDEIPVVAIRAPRIVEVGPRVRVLATLGGEPILVREKNVTGATFHPELTEDRSVHHAVFGGAASALKREGERATISLAGGDGMGGRLRARERMQDGAGAFGGRDLRVVGDGGLGLDGRGDRERGAVSGARGLVHDRDRIAGGGVVSGEAV